MPTAMLAALYGRISDDRDGEEAGVKRQLADGRRLAEQRGATIVGEFSDNDISALTGKRRPGYEALMDAVRAGEVTHLIVWQTSRLWRNRRERAEGIEVLAAAGVCVLAVKGPDLDLSSAYGRGMAGLIGEFDTMESEVKAERNRRKAEELAAEGRIGNGGPRPFGYRRIYAGEGPRRKIVRDEIDETEAAIVRECATKAVRGDSLRSILIGLHERGIRTSTGGRWSQQGLRLMLMSARIAGLREHHGVVASTAVWPAIITRDEHELLRARLGAKRRKGATTARTHYLTGFVYCSRPECLADGVRMGVVPQGGRLKYRCKPKPEGCNGRTVALDQLVKLVDAYMVARMSDPRVLRSLAAREAGDRRRAGELVAAIEADERRLSRLQDALSDDDEDDLPEVLASIRSVRRRLTSSREALADLSASPDLARLDLPDLARRWPDLHIDRKQALLRMFVQRILIHPASRRGSSVFDPARVDIVPVRRQ